MVNKFITIEDVLDKDNITKAIKCVAKRNGCAGVDGMSAKELYGFWDMHGDKVSKMIREGTYIPAPAKRGYVSKPGKKEKRTLAIPTVLDRMIQNAILFILEKNYEQVFHNSSYGFRKGRNTYMAIQKCLQYMNEGYIYVADIDIASFFDNVRQDKLIGLLENDIKDESLIKLIKRYIKTEISVGEYYKKKKRGIIQGGPLSPLFANIVLNEFDWYLDSLGLKFVRYADDVVIMSKNIDDSKTSKTVAELYLKRELGLEINNSKTKLIEASDLKYLGVAFGMNSDDIYELKINRDIKEKFYSNVKRNINKSMSDEIKWWNRIGGFNRGWINYYYKTNKEEMQSFLEDAELYQYKLLHKKISDKKIMWALLDSKQYILLSEWYDELKRREG